MKRLWKCSFTGHGPLPFGMCWITPPIILSLQLWWWPDGHFSAAPGQAEEWWLKSSCPGLHTVLIIHGSVHTQFYGLNPSIWVSIPWRAKTKPFIWLPSYFSEEQEQGILHCILPKESCSPCFLYVSLLYWKGVWVCQLPRGDLGVAAGLIDSLSIQADTKKGGLNCVMLTNHLFFLFFKKTFFPLQWQQIPDTSVLSQVHHANV